MQAPSSYAAIFEQYQAELVRYLYTLLNDREAAFDLAQETFIRGYKLWLADAHRTGWRPLLYKIATNCAIDLLRQRQRWRPPGWCDQPQLEGPADQSDERDWAVSPGETAQVELRMVILDVLGQLDPHSSTCLLLYYERGFSADEIAEITGTSQSAVWQRLSRARRLFCRLYREGTTG